MTNAYTFRPRSSYVFFGVVVFLLVFLLAGSVLVEQSLSSRVSSVAWAVLIGAGAYLIFLRPKVVVFDEGITIVNPVATYTIGWHEVESIETKFSMSIEREGKTIYAWAAPAPGRHHRRSVDPSEMRGLAHGGHEMIRPGDDPDSLSGSAAAIARRSWNQFKNSTLAGAHYSKETNFVGPIVVVVSAAVALFLN